MKCPSCGQENREDARFCDSCGSALGPQAPEGAADAPTASRPPPSDLPESFGAGRYQVEGFLGEGGRKRVYLAKDSQAGIQVAVALFSTEGVGETLLARARREAQAMAKLGEHPHVVTVFDTGEEDGRPFIVSQYMPGGDVEGLLDDEPGRRLPIDKGLAIAADVCRALEHAHARGIVHRDIKPANVWLGEDGTARLGDFGLATAGGRAGTKGALVGTVAYLPPEQALGRGTDARSDLYSLGALLYEMLTGQPPFAGDDAVSIISQHLNAAPVAPSRHNADVHPALDELVLRLLAKSPAERAQSAAELRAELQAVASAPREAAEEVTEAENPLEGLAGGIFVGREREVDELRAAADEALGGRGRLVLLVGEPGIGKTRTADELATYARVNGAKVYWGRCAEDQGAPAYWPWVQVIRSYAREADPVALAWELGQGAADIAQVVPEVGKRLGIEPSEPTGEGEEARFRVFDSISSFLTGAASSRPIVLVLDDLHWADEPSLLLLKFLARELGGSGLLIVGTYRDVELGRHHPLAEVLGELTAAEGARQVTLRGLDEPAVARYIEMSAGVEAPAGLAAAVHEQTEGNPFFVSEVVRLLVSEGRLGADGNGAGGATALTIPHGVREVVGRRLDRLSESANRALTIGAAVGRTFGFEVVERVSGLEPEKLREALAEAIAAQVLAQTPKGRYRFSHALVRETLYAEVKGAKRVDLHRSIAEVLEGFYADDPEPHLDELARHFLEAAPAGEAEKAVDYATRAGRQAIRQLAYEEAAEDFAQALEIAEMQPESDERGLCELLLELGEAQTKAGRFGAARQTFVRAADLSRTPAPDLLVRAVLGVSALSEEGGTDEEIVSLIEEALAALDEGDSAARAELLSQLSHEYYWVDLAGKAAPLGEEAVEMARRVGEPKALALALSRRLFVTLGSRSGPERVTIADEIRQLGERSGDRELTLRSHIYLLREHLELGDIPAVDRELEAYARLAGELRIPQHLWHVPLLRGMRAMIDGRLEEAEQLAEEARRGGERAEEALHRQFYAIQLALLRRQQGRIEELLPLVEMIAERYPAVRAWRVALAQIYTEVGRDQEARAQFERLASKDFDDLARDAAWLPAMALLSETCAALSDAERAAQLYERLAPYAGLTVVTGRAAACYGPVDRYLGLVATTMGRFGEAERHFDASLELSGKMGDRPFTAAAKNDLAGALLARGRRGDRERALGLLDECIDAAQEMGMRRLVDRALARKLEAQGLAGVDITTSIDEVIAAVESEGADLRAHAAADGTVTILFSDIENSTLMTERLGDERWLDVLRAHNTVFRKHIREYDGFEVKNQGDGFMLAFADPRKALECAIQIQRDFEGREDDDRIRIRMGLHTGEVILEEGDFFGKNVILAARIAATAQGGEVLVSELLKERAEGDDSSGNGGLSFDEGRELELKGLAGTHRVYRADWQELEPAAA
jgi:class 3 adenylate cyclase